MYYLNGGWFTYTGGRDNSNDNIGGILFYGLLYKRHFGKVVIQDIF